jgi:cell division septum initiation protein DivIVA
MSFNQRGRPALRVVRRGYDRGQVEKYLDSLEGDLATLRSRVENLWAELEGARQRAKTAPEDPASQARYAAASGHVAQVMQALDDEVERLHAQANDEVERMLSEARADADRIRQDAESRATEVRSLADDAQQEARKAADAIRNDAQERAEETLATAHTLLNEARDQAGQVLSDLEHRRRSLYGTLRRTRNAVDEALSNLDSEIDEEGPTNEVVLLLEDDGSKEGING